MGKEQWEESGLMQDEAISTYPCQLNVTAAVRRLLEISANLIALVKSRTHHFDCDRHTHESTNDRELISILFLIPSQSLMRCVCLFFSVTLVEKGWNL